MRWVFFWGKLLIGAALLGALFHYGSADGRDWLVGFSSPSRVFLSVGLVVLAIFLPGCRWHMLMRIQGIITPWHQAIALTFVAGFFNTFLLGGIGGDGVRLAIVARISRAPFSRILAAAAVDRLFGLEALLMIAALAAFPRLAAPATSSQLQVAVLVVVGTAAAGFLIPLLTLFLGRSRLVARMRAGLLRLGRLGRLLDDLLAALLLYRDHLFSLWVALGLSLLGHACLLAGFVVFAGSWQSGLGAMDYAFALSITLVLGIFALIPGSLGVSEAIFVTLATMMARTSMPLATLFLTFRFIIALAAAPGGVVWLLKGLGGRTGAFTANGTVRPVGLPTVKRDSP